MSGPLKNSRPGVLDRRPVAGANSLPDIHDRVTDAFNGKLGEKFAQLTRARIHWICANVIGKQVLDAGCSQGITAILLGREGHKVIGVDISPRSIDEARGFLSLEPSWVRSNVELWNGDFLTPSLDAQRFDTIIFGEILEHLTQPQAFVDAAARRLAENGRLIVTVPFGINDWPDHRRTFYLLEPWRLLSRHFEVMDVKLFGKWIGFVARLRRAEEAATESLPSGDACAAAEAAVYQIERRLTDERNELSRELTALRANYAAQAEQCAALEDKLARAEAATLEAKGTSETLARRLREIDRISSSLQAQAESAKRRLGDEYAALALEKANLERQVDELRRLLSQVEKSAQYLEMEIVAIRAEVGAREARITALQSQEEVHVRDLADQRRANGEMAESRREALNYAEMLSERLIGMLDDLRVREQDLDTLHDKAIERDRENARLSGAVAAAERDAAKLRQELQSARQREQTDGAGSRKLADELESIRRRAATERVENASLKTQLQQAASRTSAQRKQIDALEKQKAASEQRAAKAKQTISYQLGHALLQAGQSWRGAVSLPRAILALIREGRRRELSRRAEVGSSISRAIPKIETAAPKIQALSILDEISEACWGTDVKLFRLQRSKFEQQISGSNSRFAFLESCWKGNAGDWEYAFTSPDLRHANAQDLIKALKLMRARRMTIVFWNKEDPMHYDKFLPIARYADVVLTTDANKVASYERDIPAARVQVLPFAAQPHLCNPSGRTNIQQETVCCAGSYYSVDHDDRKRQMDELLPAVIEHGGSIYDRMSRVDGDRYSYPDQYAPYIRAAVHFLK